MSSAIIYEGPSVLDGEMIVAIATEGTTNRKTGSMVQVWILRADQAPVDAIRSGADASVCGECPLRAQVPGTLQGRTCYVTVGQAPQGIWRAYKAGSYWSVPYIKLAAYGAGKNLRLGAYGDPAAVPHRVWSLLLTHAAGWTGYTHQWSHPKFDHRLLGYVMASIEGDRQAPEWARHFRVRLKGAPLLPSEVDCPNTTRGVQCIDCQLCQGASKQGRSVSIEAHGAGANNLLRIM